MKKPMVEAIPKMFHGTLPCTVKTDGVPCEMPAKWLWAGGHQAYCDQHKDEAEKARAAIEAL